MKEIHEKYYHPPAVNPNYVRVGINEGLKYPEVTTCLTVTFVWPTGGRDVMIGAHIGLMVPPDRFTSVSDIAAARGLMSMKAHGAGVVFPPRLALLIGEIGVWAGTSPAVLNHIRTWLAGLGCTAGWVPATDEKDTASGGAGHNITVNRPGGWSPYRGKVTIRNNTTGAREWEYRYYR